MKKFFLISAFALFALLLFSSDSGAEEEFTISVVSGDTKLTITNTPKSWVLSSAPYSQLEVSDDSAQARISDLSKNSTFVFKLQGTNFHNDTTYTFGYRFTTYHPFSSTYLNPDGLMRGRPVEVVFSGNNSEEISYNLVGNLSQYTNSGDDNCTMLKVSVYLEGSSLGESTFDTYSDRFFLEGYNAGECIYYTSPDNEIYALYGITIGLLSLLVFSHYSAKRMNTNALVVLLLIIISFFIFPLNLLAILLCWAFGVNFGGGERDQEKYERSGETVPVLITIVSFVSIFIGLGLLLYSWVENW